MDFESENEWLECGDAARQTFFCVKRECQHLPDSLGPNEGEQLKDWRNRVMRYKNGYQKVASKFKSWLIGFMIYLFIPVLTPLLFVFEISISNTILLAGLSGYFFLGIPFVMAFGKRIKEMQVHRAVGCLNFHVDALFGKRIEQIAEMQKEIAKRKKLTKYRSDVKGELESQLKDDRMNKRAKQLRQRAQNKKMKS